MKSIINLTKSHYFFYCLFVIFAVLGYFIITNYSHRNDSSQNMAPPPQVGVQTLQKEKIQIWKAFSGRMQAIDYAQIRPEISGRIIEVRFKDGQNVNKGDVLFVIDPRPYEAALSKAQANLASAKTNAALAKIEFGRAEQLIKTHAIAQNIYDQRNTTNAVAQNQVAASEAELKQAQVNVDYAYVKAPFSGRIGRVEITLGNLVQAGLNAPVLTSIVSNDGIYADFEVDEQTYMSTVHMQANTQEKEQQIPVKLTVQDGDHRTYLGFIYTFDNRIDTTTGTIRARAKFANKEGSLVPGMFVTVRLGSAKENTVLLVSEKAISNDQSKKYVFIVDKNNKVAYREVTLGDEVNGKRIVLSGLHSGDRVIVKGIQFVSPDLVVDATELMKN